MGKCTYEKISLGMMLEIIGLMSERMKKIEMVLKFCVEEGFFLRINSKKSV